MIVAYHASPPETKNHMWADPKTRGTAPPGVLCEICRQRINYSAINPNYRPPRTYHDLCRTYDGDFLVSACCRELIESAALPGVWFVELARCSRYSVLQCSNILRVIRPPSFREEEYCSACGQFKSVYGLWPEIMRFEGLDAPLGRGIFFSDVKTGYGPVMGPSLIIGTETWLTLLGQKLKGIDGHALLV